MSLFERVRSWFFKPAVERAEEERYMSQAERDEVDERIEGVEADVRAEERLGPLPHERDDE